jgi:carbonic anhydrase/acetyltransferase-like protein (isoleucine patch superfamily)
MIHKFKKFKPEIHQNCFIAGNADIIGRVRIEEEVSIWFGAVLRGDLNKIHIGKGTNIQDNCTVHVDADGPGTVVGEYVTVGHNSVLHGCSIGSYSMVGMGAVVLEGAVVGEETIIGAGSLVTSNKTIPSGVLCIGSPAKVIRDLTDDEKAAIRKNARDYIELANEYKVIERFNG